MFRHERRAGRDARSRYKHDMSRVDAIDYEFKAELARLSSLLAANNAKMAKQDEEIERLLTSNIHILIRDNSSARKLQSNNAYLSTCFIPYHVL